MREETKCLHAGYTPKNGEPRVVPNLSEYNLSVRKYR